MDLVTPQRSSQVSLERIPDGKTPDPSQSVAEAQDAFLETLKALLPQAPDFISKTQARCKRDYEKKFRPRRVSMTSGVWNHLRNYTRKRKLYPKMTGPFEVLETDGKHILSNKTAYPTGLAATMCCRRDQRTHRTDPNDPKWRSLTRSNLVGPSSC